MLPVRKSSYKIDYIGTFGSAPHSHNINSEIIQCFTDNGHIIINGEFYKLKKNGLYFIHGLDKHFVVPEDLNRYYHSIILVNTEEIHKICKNLEMEEKFIKIFTQNGGLACELTDEMVIKVDSIFLKIDNILKDYNDMKYARLSVALIELFEIGLNHACSNAESNEHISKIFSLINDHAFDNFTLNEICEEINISKYHLCRIFKENLGMTITEFVKRKRLSLARRLLKNTDLKTTEIAQKCGFCNSSFFAKVFLREYGITPTDYRTKYR